MYRRLLRVLRCPACGDAGRLAASRVLETEPDGELVAGLLACTACGETYRVEEGVADLSPAPLREDDRETAFRHRHRLPGWTHTAARDEFDLRLLGEGRHWGAFMRRWWEAGDRSIFDMRVRGTHPSLLAKGIATPDPRDRWRRWSFFPPGVGDMMFPRMGGFRGRLAWDLGCGGGQFGLEAARRGLRVVGTDPAFEALVLARRHARRAGVRRIEHVRAFPHAPPLRRGCIDVLLAKDALHHVPDLAKVMPVITSRLAPDAWVIAHEHVARAERKEWLFRALFERLSRRARSRHPPAEIPPEFLRDSPNEDASAHAVEPCLREWFRPVALRHDLYLAAEAELYAWYAMGRRAWLARSVYTVAGLLEWMLVLAGDRQHLTFVGQQRK